MARNLSALLAGLLFGLGLTISEMTNPAKVLGFLDVLDRWDPSLALVMGAALIVTTIGYRLAWLRRTPLFAAQFHLPKSSSIDKKLAIGALLFGIGWGLVGLCPGPSISALAIGGSSAWLFFAAMVAGMVVYEFTARREWR